MIVNNYTTHAYCEVCNEMVESIGSSKTGTFKKLRKDGWALSKDEQRAYCPKHNKWKRKKNNEK